MSRSSAAARAFSGPKRVTSRPKSWFESTQAAPGRRGGGLDRGTQVLGVPARVEQLEREGRVEVLEVGLPFRARQVDLPHEQRVPHGLADPRERLAGVRRVARVGERELPLVRAQRQSERLGRGRVVSQLRVLQEPVDRVHAVARGAALDPEAERVLHRRHDLGIAPVEVRLLGIERVQVVAAVRAGSTPSRRTRTVQLFGASAQMYQSGCSRNHGCSIDVWHGTRSSSTRSPRSRAAATRLSKSSSEPNTGSTSS